MRARIAMVFACGLLVAGPALGRKPKRGDARASVEPGKRAALEAALKAALALDRSAIPPGGPAPKVALPRPERFRLASGPQVLVVPRHELPMAIVAVVWPRGGGDELPTQAGIAEFTADLMNEGTAKHDALALAEAADAIGAELGTGANWDLTVASVKTLTKHLDVALGLLAEVVIEPAFDPKELSRQRDEKRTQLLARKDSAARVASELLSATIYGPNRRYGLPLIGTEETVARLSREDVVGWYQRELRPESATILVVGDVGVERARASLEAAFGAWRSEAPPVLGGYAQGPMPRARRVIVDKPGAPQSELRLGLPGPSHDSPDYFPLLVLNEVLGGGQFANRLNMNLREAHAYTYGAHSDLGFHRDGGPFAVWSAVKTEVTGPATMEAMSELLRIRSVPIDPAELRFAKDGLIRGMAGRFETGQAVLGELATIVVHKLPDDFLHTFADKVEAVTIEDVQRAATKYIDPTKLTMVIVGDRAQVQKQLAETPLGAFEEVDASGKPVPPPAPPPTTNATPVAPAAAPKK